MIDTFDKLMEYVAACIGVSQEAKTQGEKAQAIGEGVTAVAEFMLAVVPTDEHHRAYVASVMVKRMRKLNSPFVVLAREQGDIEKVFQDFMTATESWQETHH